MITIRLFWRMVALIGAVWRISSWNGRRRELGWQDKRRAVGWGAGYWNYWEICASQLPSRLASSTKNGAILAFSAPSLRQTLQIP